MSDREILKKKWKQQWKWEIAAQKHQEYMISKRKPYKASKEFKKFVKDFAKKK